MNFVFSHFWYTKESLSFKLYLLLNWVSHSLPYVIIGKLLKSRIKNVQLMCCKFKWDDFVPTVLNLVGLQPTTSAVPTPGFDSPSYYAFLLIHLYHNFEYFNFVVIFFEQEM